MKKQIQILLLAMIGTWIVFSSQAQEVPVVVEAESGILGSDYTTGTDGDITYVEPQTNYINAGNPGSETKVITYEITFPKAGNYDVYIKLYVGSATYDDDSFFAANGIGSKSSTADADWIIVNGLASAGFTVLTDVVNEGGGLPSELWKWVNLTVFAGVSLTVEAGSLTQTFQIGAREDGLRIDKLVFQEAGLYVTVANLENGEAGSTTEPGKEPIGPPLATGLDKFLGCAFGSDSKKDFEGFWNQVTPGNAGKWGWVEGTRDVMTWNDLDETYAMARDNGFIFKHHVLVWGSQQPAWIKDLSPTDQLAEIEEWFAAIAERYDTIDMIEVVNEPLHQPPDANNEGDYIGALGGAGTTGWDWIIKSFEMARTYFPNTDLLINEYGIINSKDNTKKYLEIIRLLQERDLIDGICFQGHGFSLRGSVDVMAENLDSMAATGLPLYVSELDIDGLTDKQQVTGFQRYFKLFWEHPSVEGITFWGFRPGMWRTEQMAYLFDLQGTPRPAWEWLVAYLGDSVVYATDLSISTAGGATEINTMDGTLQMSAEVLPENVTIDKVHWTASPTSVATIGETGLLTAVGDGTVTVYATTLDEDDIQESMEITVSNQSVGIFSTTENNIRMYPNPSYDGVVNIDGIENMNKLKVYSLLGNEIFSKLLSGNTEEILVLDVEPGMYIIQVSNETDFIKKRIVVK